jgi:hypothetical protein
VKECTENNYRIEKQTGTNEIKEYLTPYRQYDDKKNEET